VSGRAVRSAPVCTEAQRDKRPSFDPVIELAETKLTDTEWLDFVQGWLPWTIPFVSGQGSWE
jgi:hypothetical protein